MRVMANELGSYHCSNPLGLSAHPSFHAPLIVAESETEAQRKGLLEVTQQRLRDRGAKGLPEDSSSHLGLSCSLAASKSDITTHPGTEG